MLKQADVLAENFRQVQWKNWGFHGKRYKKSTRAHLCFIVRFWAYRPAKRCSCHDTIIQAMSGIMMETGYPDARQCVWVPLLRIYVAVSIYSVNSECTLWPRKEPTRGACRYTMFDATLSFLEHGLMAYIATGSHHNVWEIVTPTWHLLMFSYSG